MAARSLSPEVTLWTDAKHAPLAGDVMNLMGSAVKPIAVGGAPVAEVNQLAKSLNCDKHDDLRKMSIDRPAAYLLLASHDGVTPDDLHALTGQGTAVLSLEPIASDLQGLRQGEQLLGGAGSEGTGRIVLTPMFSQSPGFLGAADPNELLGDRRMIRFTSDGKPAHGSLFARLFDAWQTVLSFALMPETIDASLVGPLDETPDTLPQLAGSLAAHARITGGGAALIAVSDAAGRSRRALNVRGEDATLAINDLSYALTDKSGKVLDELEDTTSPAGFADMLAHQWRRLLDNPTATRSALHPTQQADAMACCLACLLSIRTGQPESPGKILQMNR